MNSKIDSNALQSLRRLVHDCLAKHFYDSAIFYADKLAVFTNYAPIEVYNLANAFYVANQYHRCLHLLRNSDLIDKDIRFRFLASKCLAELKEWDLCLEMLGGVYLESSEDIAHFPCPPSTPGATLDYVSAVALLRAQVYDAQENFPRAVQWYKEALIRDPFNYGAFEALVSRHKLTVEEETSFIAEICRKLPSDQQWLALLYRSKCKQYDATGIEGTYEAIIALGGAGSDDSTVPSSHHLNNNNNNTAHTPARGSPDVSMGGITPVQPSVTTRAAARRSGSAAGSINSSMAVSPISDGTSDGITPQNALASSQIHTSSNDVQPQSTWGLSGAADVAAAHAELLLRHGQFYEAFSLTSGVLEKDPFVEVILSPHLSASVALGKKNELFSLGHRLMKASPNSALSWYAAGCYYFCTNQYSSARQYFAKATELDRRFAPAWIGFAQAFSAQDETDQAMAAYRTAARLFPGHHMPLLGMGLEYIRMNNLSLAEQTLLRAHRRCPSDAAVAHELGTLAYRQGQYMQAVQWLLRALESTPKENYGQKEPTMVNLGHALRKLKRYDDAVDTLKNALGVAPHQAGTYAALGYTYHLMGKYEDAIENYHKALGLKPTEDFCSTMLAIAVAEETDHRTAQLLAGGASSQRYQHPMGMVIL